jgi:membrane protease YdiL (CAAX protease family)
MNRTFDPEELFRRLVLFARGLGFVFLVYFIPAFLRDLLGMAWPGGGLVGALQGDPDGPWFPLAIAALTLTPSILAVRWHARIDARETPATRTARAGRRGVREWGLGFLLGAGVASLAVIPSLLAGAIEFVGPSAGGGPSVLAFTAVVLILLGEAAREELGFRGPAQRDLARAVTSLPAAVFLAGSFALIHRANPDMTNPGLLGIFLAGVALAGVVRARGGITMACGLHAGWNVALGLAWCTPVSGFRLDAAPLETVSRDSWLSGGSFGPEGSVPGIAVLTLLALAAWTRRPAMRPANALEGEVPAEHAPRAGSDSLESQ